MKSFPIKQIAAVSILLNVILLITLAVRIDGSSETIAEKKLRMEALQSEIETNRAISHEYVRQQADRMIGIR